MIDTTIEHLGVIGGMPLQEYLAQDALSNGDMKLLADRTPWHLHEARAARAAGVPGKAPGDGMRIGSRFHCATLEAKDFDVRYPIGPNVSKNSNAWKDYVKLHADAQEVITEADRDRAFAMAAAVHRIPDVAALLADGRAEQSVFWRDPATGMRCKCRPDWVSYRGIEGKRGAILLDLKSTPDARASVFERSIWNFGYFRQAAWYCRGWEQATGDPVLGFMFVACEVDPPYGCIAYMLKDEAFARGLVQCERLLTLYASCVQRGTWPGYPLDIQLIGLPTWAIEGIAP